MKLKLLMVTEVTLGTSKCGIHRDLCPWTGPSFQALLCKEFYTQLKKIIIITRGEGGNPHGFAAFWSDPVETRATEGRLAQPGQPGSRASPRKRMHSASQRAQGLPPRAATRENRSPYSCWLTSHREVPWGRRKVLWAKLRAPTPPRPKFTWRSANSKPPSVTPSDNGLQRSD